MGHKNIETTIDIYAEATDRKKEETFENLAEKLDELFLDKLSHEMKLLFLKFIVDNWFAIE